MTRLKYDGININNMCINTFNYADIMLNYNIDINLTVDLITWLSGWSVRVNTDSISPLRPLHGLGAHYQFN